MIILMVFTSVPYVIVFVLLSMVFISANSKGQLKDFRARNKSVFQRLAGGVTGLSGFDFSGVRPDFAAAQGAKMKHRQGVSV